jgi:hypothetical protein
VPFSRKAYAPGVPWCTTTKPPLPKLGSSMPAWDGAAPAPGVSASTAARPTPQAKLRGEKRRVMPSTVGDAANAVQTGLGRPAAGSRPA